MDTGRECRSWIYQVVCRNIFCHSHMWRMTKANPLLSGLSQTAVPGTVADSPWTCAKGQETARLETSEGFSWEPGFPKTLHWETSPNFIILLGWNQQILVWGEYWFLKVGLVKWRSGKSLLKWQCPLVTKLQESCRPWPGLKMLKHFQEPWMRACRKELRQLSSTILMLMMCVPLQVGVKTLMI